MSKPDALPEPFAVHELWGQNVDVYSAEQMRAYAQSTLDAAVAAAPKWLPIETAPEGEHILLWFPNGERGIGGMECGTIYRNDPIAPGGIGIWTHGGPNSGSDWQLDEAPTHWMNLPATPQPAPDKG